MRHGKSVFIILVALLALLFSACEKVSDEDKYFALLEDVYGKDFVAKLPQQEGYGMLMPYSLPDLYPSGEKDKLVLIPIEELSFNAWDFFKQFEYYSGHDISFTPATDSFKKGSIVTLTISNNYADPSTEISHSPGFHIEMLVDGQWKYICNTDPPGLVGVDNIRPGDDFTIQIDSQTFNVRRLYEYNETLGEYTYAYPENREVLLPAGRYRVTKPIDRPELCLLTCEFEIV